MLSFSSKGELIAGFDIINWITFPNQSFVKVKVGRMASQNVPGKIFTISEDEIQWAKAFNQVDLILLSQSFSNMYLWMLYASFLPIPPLKNFLFMFLINMWIAQFAYNMLMFAYVFVVVFVVEDFLQSKGTE